MDKEYCRLSLEKTIILCEKIFRNIGMTDEDARVVSESLMFADLRGISTHGITRLKSYVSRAQKGYYNVTPNISVVDEKRGTYRLDGDNAFGAVAGRRAMNLSIQKAKEAGVGFGVVSHSNHYGAASYFTSLAAEQDMIGFSCTNAPANMAPFGCIEKMLGTNPFSVAIPSNRFGLIVLDIATSIVARGKLINAAKNGENIPDGWAVDLNGNPTNNPNVALKGAILPFGAYKGSGIAIIIDVICGVLSGSAFGRHIQIPEQQADCIDRNRGSNIGHAFMAIDIASMLDTETFKMNVDCMIDELKRAKKAAGIHEIMFPGEIEQIRLKENKKLGIPISSGVYQEIKSLCDEQDLETLFQECIYT